MLITHCAESSMSVLQKLLEELEQFAHRGCPDVAEMQRRQRQWHSNAPGGEGDEHHEAIMREQAKRRAELIAQLKQQLRDLEQFAYDADDGELPTDLVLEKQVIVP